MIDEVEDIWKIYSAQLGSLLDPCAYKEEDLGETWSYSQSVGSQGIGVYIRLFAH